MLEMLANVAEVDVAWANYYIFASDKLVQHISLLQLLGNKGTS